MGHPIQQAWLAPASGPLHGLCPLLRGLNYSTVGEADSFPLIKTPMKCHLLRDAFPVLGSEVAPLLPTSILITSPCWARGKQPISGSGFFRKEEAVPCQTSTGGTNGGYLGGGGWVGDSGLSSWGVARREARYLSVEPKNSHDDLMQGI